MIETNITKLESLDDIKMLIEGDVIVIEGNSALITKTDDNKIEYVTRIKNEGRIIRQTVGIDILEVTKEGDLTLTEIVHPSISGASYYSHPGMSGFNEYVTLNKRLNEKGIYEKEI